MAITDCPVCGFANPLGLGKCAACGSDLLHSKPMNVFGVEVSYETEPYLIYQHWYDDKPRVVSRMAHQTNVLFSAFAFAVNFLAWIPLVGLGWALVIVLSALVIVIPLAYRNFTKGRARAEEVKARLRAFAKETEASRQPSGST